MQTGRFRLTIRILLVLGLLALALMVLWPFLNALAWSVVLAVSLWPLNRRLRPLFPRAGHTAAALVMSFGLALFILAALFPLGLELSREVREAFSYVCGVAEMRQGDIIDALSAIPLVGDQVRSFASQELDIGAEIRDLFASKQEQIVALASLAAKGLLSFVATLILVVFCTFFLFRDGDLLAAQVLNLMRTYGTERGEGLLFAAWNTVLGVVYGVLSTSIIQGILAGIGYAFSGAPSPVLLGCITSFSRL